MGGGGEGGAVEAGRLQRGRRDTDVAGEARMMRM